jgi:hypothetical protein
MTTSLLITVVVVAVLLGLFLAVVREAVACRLALDDAMDDVYSLRGELRQTRREVTQLRKVAALLEIDLQREREERREAQLVLFEVLEERGVPIRRVPLATGMSN